MSDNLQQLLTDVGNLRLPASESASVSAYASDIRFSRIRIRIANAKAETNGAVDSLEDDDDPPRGIDYRQCFEELVEAYPQAGRQRLQQAYAAFMKAMAEESKQRSLGSGRGVPRNARRPSALEGERVLAGWQGAFAQDFPGRAAMARGSDFRAKQRPTSRASDETRAGSGGVPSASDAGCGGSE